MTPLSGPGVVRGSSSDGGADSWVSVATRAAFAHVTSSGPSGPFEMHTRLTFSPWIGVARHSPRKIVCWSAIPPGGSAARNWLYSTRQFSSTRYSPA